VRYIVIYDITDDNLRNKVSERLKDYGLERIQFSAFQGELARHVVSSLQTDMRRLLHDGEETDSVIFFPLCNSCFNGKCVIGAGKEMEKDGEKVSFF